MSHPIHYRVERPQRFTRAQLAARLLAFFVAGLLGISFGSFFMIAYLVLPLYAANRASAKVPYAENAAPKVLRAFYWVAAYCAWAGLITDRLPAESPDETVQLELEEAATVQPTVASALWRVLLGIPSALVLGLAGFVGTFVWIWAAVSILISERVGPTAFDYLVGLQRWSVRLLAYQASLVEPYPPFSFRETEHGVAEASS
jgi:hypothetical protein